MLKVFQEKYKNLIDHYFVAREELEKGLKLFEESKVDFKTLVKQTAEAAYSYTGGNLEWFTAEFNRAAKAYDSQKQLEQFCKKFGYSYNDMLANSQTFFYYIMACETYRWRYHMCVEATYSGKVTQVTEGNYNDVLTVAANMAYKDFVESCQRYRLNVSSYYNKMLASPLHKQFVGHFTKLSETINENKLRSAAYVRDLVLTLEMMANIYPVVKDINHNGSPVDNLKQLQLLLEVHNIVRGTVGVTSAYANEWVSLHKYWDDKVTGELNVASINLDANTLKQIEDECKAEYLRLFRAARAEVEKNKASYLDKKTQKKLTKSFAKACKLYSKGKSYDKVVVWVNSEAVNRADLENALSQKNFDLFLSYWMDSVANSKTSADAITKFRKQKTDQAKKELVERLKLTANTPSSAKFAFVHSTLPRCYVFVSAALLDCLVELAYTDTYAEFGELPDNLQTTAVVGKILEYFDKKRVNTVKDAIDLYFAETKEEERPAAVVNDKERRANAQMIADQCRAIEEQEQYKEMRAKLQQHQAEVDSSVKKHVEQKSKEIAKCKSSYDYISKIETSTAKNKGAI